MDWRKFIKKLQALGYDGGTDNLDEVTSWLKENGHDDKTLVAKGKNLSIRELWDNRPGQTLDVSDAADEAEYENDVHKKAEELLAERERAGLIQRRRNGNGEHPHQVRVIKERIEDDPCVGYNKFAELGAGQFLFDVRQHAICIKEGRTAEIPQRLIKSQQVMYTKAGIGMNEATDSEGGFLSPTEHRNELLRKMYSVGNVFPRARQVAMTSKTLDTPYIVEASRVDGSRHGGVQGFWGAEGATLTASKPSLGMLTLTAHKLHALGHLTSEVDEDSAAQGLGAMQLLAELFAEELAFKLDDAFIRGTGAGMPLGILNSPALIASGTRNVADRFNCNDAANMWSRLPASSYANATWFVNQDVLPDLIMLSGSSVTSTVTGYFVPNGVQYSAGGQLSIFGRPVVPIEQLPSIADPNAVLLADMTQYLHGNRRGITTSQSIHIRFNTDETSFKATLRADGQPWWQAPLTPFISALTISPFVGIPT